MQGTAADFQGDYYIFISCKLLDIVVYDRSFSNDVERLEGHFPGQSEVLMLVLGGVCFLMIKMFFYPKNIKCKNAHIFN